MKCKQLEIIQNRTSLFSGAQASAAKGPMFTGEYLEYNSGWMVAMITEDASSEVKLTDLSEGNRYQVGIRHFLKFFFTQNLVVSTCHKNSKKCSHFCAFHFFMFLIPFYRKLLRKKIKSMHFSLLPNSGFLSDAFSPKTEHRWHLRFLMFSKC